MTHEQCLRCNDARDKYDCTHVPQNLLVVHLPVKVLLKKSDEKQQKLKEFIKQASAVRNSGGGHLLIHLEGKSEDDSYLGYFDQFAESPLLDLIEDGTVYTDNYVRKWLCEDEDLTDYFDFLVLVVKASRSISTAEFNTRVCTDQSVRKPSRYNILSLLQKHYSPQTVTDESPKEKDLDTPLRTADTELDGQILHESRNVQFKTFFREKVGHLVDNCDKLCEYIWTDLRLREYVCSMSMLETGGSFYIGIGEKDIKVTVGETYCSKIPDFHGMAIDEGTVKSLCEKLISKSESDICVFVNTSNNITRSVTPRFLENVVHKVTKDNKTSYILQIIIKPVKGIVFYDCGPKSYHMRDRVVQEVPVETWFTKILSENC